MSPKKGDTSDRPNRIRFIMLDADISDGNLSEITQAITSALKPVSGPVRQLPLHTSPRNVLPGVQSETNGGTATSDAQVRESETVDPGNGEEQPTSESKTKYSPPQPAYLPTLDLKGGGSTSFKEYAEAKKPTTHAKRYLVAALWLKEHGNSPTINADKVYTCYKTAGWPLRITDWDVNFRSQVKASKMQRVSPKEYAITPLGEAELQDE
jgi:hypothetical protein